MTAVARDRRIPLSDSYVALTAITIYYDGTLSTSQSWSKAFVEISIMDKGFEPKYVFHFVACVLYDYMYLDEGFVSLQRTHYTSTNYSKYQLGF